MVSVNNIRFDKVIALCPVKRLGSNADLGPFVDAFINHFGERAIIAGSREFNQLHRYRIEKGVRERGINICELEPSYARGTRPQLTGQMMNDIYSVQGRKMVLPVADDYETSRIDARLFANIRNKTVVGLDRTDESICYDDDSGDLNEFCEGMIDHVVKSGKEDVPIPLFLNGYLELIKNAADIDDPSVGFMIPDHIRKPMVWTSDEEVRKAEEFFQNAQLSPERTIGVHLTAGSYRVFDQLFPARSFERVIKYLADKKYDLLFMGGGLNEEDPTALKTNKAVHIEMASSLNSSACRFFWGDALVMAEMIRRCRMFFSAETGPAHIASAVGTPKVTIAAGYHLQSEMFLMTGPNDAGFLAGMEDGNKVVFPEEDKVIAAFDRILSEQNRGNKL